VAAPPTVDVSRVDLCCTLTNIGSQVKPQAEAFLLPAPTINAYLSSTPALTVTPAASCPPVSRDFMRLAYGGSNQQFVQLVKADRNVSSNPTPQMRRIVWPMLTMNPAMPRYPGAPGLVFASRHDILYNGPWTVFCPDVTNKKFRRWIYLGEYESEIVGQLTAEEFSSQATTVSMQYTPFLPHADTLRRRSRMNGASSSYRRGTLRFTSRCDRESR
jgi:hypothetical protein